MSNMHYCRFQNTRSDLEECQEELSENGFSDLSEEEKQAAKDILEIIQDMYFEHKELIEELS